MICEHDWNTLNCALRFDGDPKDFVRRNAADGETFWSTRDPAKLARMMAGLLQNKFGASVVIIAPNRSLHRTPSRLEFVVYWDNDHGGTIQIKPPCGHNDIDMSRVLGMPQARALLLKWLHLPEGACDEAERALRGEAQTNPGRSD